MDTACPDTWIRINGSGSGVGAGPGPLCAAGSELAGRLMCRTMRLRYAASCLLVSYGVTRAHVPISPPSQAGTCQLSVFSVAATSDQLCLPILTRQA